MSRRSCPGAPGCRALVTSRRRLAGLDDVHRLSIGPLARIIGDGRAASTADLAEVAGLCGGLSLAGLADGTAGSPSP